MDQAAQSLAYESQKSSLAFRTISEVSMEIDVPQHVLRFWESRFSQVKPMKRGGGRRYYRPEDVALLLQIKNYLYKQGYTIKGVQRLLKEHRLSELPSLAAYRMHAQENEALSADAPTLEENAAETFAEVTALAEAPLVNKNDPFAAALTAVTNIHDEIQVPIEPMRIETARVFDVLPDEDAQPTHLASKETGYVAAPPENVAQQQAASAAHKAELEALSSELGELRDMLRKAAA